MSVATVRVAETLGTGFAFAPTKYGREDDRLPNELRPIKFKLGNLSRADGSVRYLQGKYPVHSMCKTGMYRAICFICRAPN